MTSGTQLMFWIFEVNGEATDASASDNEIPTWAKDGIIYSIKSYHRRIVIVIIHKLPAFKAPQSFAPSPHMPTSVLQ